MAMRLDGCRALCKAEKLLQPREKLHSALNPKLSMIRRGWGMSERGPSLAEIIGAQLAGVFRAHPPHRASPHVPHVLRSVVVARPCAADDKLVAAYRDLLRMPA
tara:strand:- start:45866 stop:46177 length:312 start_codon:yes stop_codon:yes gene_type:complete